MQKEKGEIHSGIDGRGKGDIGLRYIVEAKGGRGIKNTNFLASLGNIPPSKVITFLQRMRVLLSPFKKKSPITLSISALISLSNQTIPLFLPLFRPKIGFPGCLCSCTVYRKRKKSENRDFSKKPMNKGFSTYSLHRVNIPSTYPHFVTR